MQRAAASSPTTPSSPSTPDEPSPKRRKKDSDSWSPSTSSFDVNALADQRAIQAAIAAEEAKKEAALERAAHESGDTRWVLSFEDQRASSPSSSLALRVVQTGYASLDAPSRAVEEDMDEDKPVMVGRRSFGKFNKVLEKKDGEDESESSSEEDEEHGSEEESDDDDPASELIRASRQEAVAQAKEERKKQKRAEQAESEKLAKKRKKENPSVNLNGLTSLSGRAPSVACHNCGGPHYMKDCTQPKKFKGACHKCGGPHHIKDCPQTSKRSYQGGDDGPPRKAIKSR